jgi:hypothetical protein
MFILLDLEAVIKLNAISFRRGLLLKYIFLRVYIIKYNMLFGFNDPFSLLIVSIIT